MQCLFLAIKNNFDFCAALIVRKTDMKRLMEITHEMHDVIQRNLFFSQRRVIVADFTERTHPISTKGPT